MWRTICGFSFILQLIYAYPYQQMLISYSMDPMTTQQEQTKEEAFALFNCRFAVNRQCPDPEVTFYLYTKQHPENPEMVQISAEENGSDLHQTAFDPRLPTKVIIHGFNSDMHLAVLNEVTKEYIKSNQSLNIFTVDWGPLSQGPCYPAAVWNAKHVGQCTAQLVEILKGTGNHDIHVIGFSLGAHVTNHMAVTLRPYKVPRITGLDPALPGYVTADLDGKLDKTDAEYVDVIHTNAFMQGKVEESGHSDFYLNGGVVQPGCWAETRFFACNHHRAPLYFAESINTDKGFWGWPCPSYLQYLLGQCHIREDQILMGAHINKTTTGVFLVITESISPYAVGKYTGPAIEVFHRSNENYRLQILKEYRSEVMSYMEEDNLVMDDMFGINGEERVQYDLDNMFVNDIFSYSDNFTDPLFQI